MKKGKIMSKIKIDLELYAVRNRDGQWFRAKGYGGGGRSWVDDISYAKIYANLSQARSRVTFFANSYSQFGVPEIVKFIVKEGEILDETDRVEKAKRKKKERKIRSDIRRKKELVERTKQELAVAQDKLKKLGS